MKSGIFCLLLMVIALNYALSCNPDGNNKPVCSQDNLNQPIRNFWDPTCYWLCGKAGEEPICERCMSSTMFDSAQGKCIPYYEWEWTPPCPFAVHN
ncbi:uncharacterized protein LOC119631790 [Glossina fuscipes]|uniref:Uncharacterized protein LOC119631790 n=1 Tax=Glossina fuscipes TaxID=7396 RepID=A0A8U0W4U0_9MUSC|nr:uncharacterized protein LOC119631790 [Glossina fuscipes]XP_037880223.1 uncharacterized protein LOC119631790 [Glossina fuscipes]XP_037880224.1 uncharacterized protein LOC119631790 [Glossina fuscipes]XP_037880225.1 uncharacterized protein LOC119631790 [Glossina fuscipes]KAI9587195.1 hypothetical protein GQX74_003042 [Glossina fuscipes]